MVVWFSAGLPLTAWIRPVLVFVMPLVLTISVLSLFLSPWALSQSAEFRGKLSSRHDAGQISPGAFQESSAGDRVVFVEGVADDTSNVSNVFVNELRPDRLGVTMAASGHQEIAENGDRFIVLQNGRRYEFPPGTAEFRIMEYARYAVRVETREARGIVPTPRTMPTVDLLPIDLPVYRAELLYRFSMPFSAVVLALLAIPLSFVNPRAGRSANMLLAILVYLIYNNLVTISQGWVASGKVSFAFGVLAVHLFMLALLPLMFYHRIAVIIRPSVSMKIYRRYLAREVSAPSCWCCWLFWPCLPSSICSARSRVSDRAGISCTMPLLSSCCARRGVPMN
jgi:lipopolysaccharide export system permease protein